MRARFIVENFEKPSEWVLLEYKHCAKIAGKGNIVITGLNEIGKADKRKISAIAPSEGANSWRLDLPDPIILDPAAKEILEPEDFSEGESFVVIGGICGDFPPKARTGDLLTKHFPGARVRSLGSLQLPTDIALWTALQISRGKRLSHIPFFPQGEFDLGGGETVSVNLGYPLVGGKALVTPGLLKLLKERKKF